MELLSRIPVLNGRSRDVYEDVIGDRHVVSKFIRLNSRELLSVYKAPSLEQSGRLMRLTYEILLISDCPASIAQTSYETANYNGHQTVKITQPKIFGVRYTDRLQLIKNKDVLRRIEEDRINIHGWACSLRFLDEFFLKNQRIYTEVQQEVNEDDNILCTEKGDLVIIDW